MYNKLFTKILDSSIWLEPTATRIVWVTLIAAMDRDHFAQFASIGNLAHRSIVSIEDAERAVSTLESPDPNSADKDFEGRRIERVPGGWMILNGQKYADIVTREEARRQTRERVARHRAKHKALHAVTEPLRNENVTQRRHRQKEINKEKGQTHTPARKSGGKEEVQKSDPEAIKQFGHQLTEFAHELKNRNEVEQ